MSGKPRAVLLISKIQSEGYCCLTGYLRLCKARGEKPNDMAENLRKRPDTIWHAYRKLENGDYTCQKYSDCMLPIIEEIEKDKAP